MGYLQAAGLRRKNQWERLTVLDRLLLSPLAFLAVQFYTLMLWLRGKPFRSPRNKTPIKVVCISDTHDLTVDVPEGDILIHAGDLTNEGTVADIQKQVDWLKSMPHAVKVVVCGNHDSYFDRTARKAEDVKSGAKPDFGEILYLEGDMTVQKVKGRKVTIFGAPDIPQCGGSDFAFQYTPDSHPWLNRIPPETEILVTHGPPKHHLDLDLGCPHLLREVWRVRPRLHVFGHCHWAYGTEPIYFDKAQMAYERVCMQVPRGLLLDFIPNAQWLDMAKLVVHSAQAVAWKWLMGGPASNQGSLMVNAAQMYGNTGKVKSRAVVVEI